MFWTDKLVGEIKEKYTEKIKAGKPLVIRDEKTMSGRVHVGSLRGVAIHGIISEILNKQEIANTYLFEINDFDLMDGLPVYLDQGKYLPYMGYLLCDIPAPNGKAKNYAEYFAEEFLGVIKQVGFNPEYYRSSELYRAGKYNKVIKIALENASKIRAIYKKVSGAEKEDDWFPLQVKCEKCGKVATTKVISYGEEEVEYVCKEDLVKWTKGCSYRGKISPFDGNAKLPWKVEWAAKFKVLGVDIEGAGKDHSTRGGSREIAETISREVFGHIPPFNIPYEFFQVGGKKMSSSRGAGSSSKEISNLLPPEILRLLLLGKNPNKVIDFIPDGDTIPILYDLYDKMAAEYFAKKEGDYQRIFSLIHASEKIKERLLPRFSQIAFLVQMPHMEIEEEVKEIKGKKLSGEDRKEINHRAKYAKNWLTKYAPEDYRYELQEKEIPAGTKNFSADQKKTLQLILQYVQSQEKLDGQLLHSKLHDIKTEIGINPQDLFSAIYLSFLGKTSGPKAGWFLSVLDKEFLEKRLAEASK
ncbi:MAG: lysine--tRNA ligase [Candidatus Moranbacteria bacterium CG_4_9_14_3_um_filter_40_7]|nr:MAG: lysine--tRNA ligase [Candidatus Moranbacteria bacterium CG_4_9_14_3_um_filter_40_7]